jgi:hypothetical protein
MSHLKYSSYEGAGQHNLKTYHYNQAVRIPAGADRVELSGQGKSQHIISYHMISYHITNIRHHYYQS